ASPHMFFFLNDRATTEIYTLSLHDALPIFRYVGSNLRHRLWVDEHLSLDHRSEEHTSELQSLAYLVCRLLLEKKISGGVWRDDHGRVIGSEVEADTSGKP